MSTKIHSGYRLRAGVDMFTLAKKTREVFLPILQKDTASELLREIVFAYDRLDFNEDTKQDYLRAKDLEGKEITEWTVRYRCIKDLAEYMKENPKWYQIRLGFAPDPETKMMLCYFSGKHVYEDVFEDFNEVAEYGYWNNSEPPENVTDEEWDERKKVWNRVLAPTDIIQTAMLMSSAVADYEISPFSFDYETMQELGVEFPTREERIKNLAEILALKTIVLDATQADFFEAFNRAMRDTKLLESKAAEVDETLRDLSFDDLITWRAGQS